MTDQERVCDALEMAPRSLGSLLHVLAVAHRMTVERSNTAIAILEDEGAIRITSDNTVWLNARQDARGP